MTLRIDKAGRIVVPKPVRERLGLHPGAEIEAAEISDGLLLTPVRDRPSLVRVKGLWVHQGVAPAGFDWNRFISGERAERDRKGSGL